MAVQTSKGQGQGLAQVFQQPNIQQTFMAIDQMAMRDKQMNAQAQRQQQAATQKEDAQIGAAMKGLTPYGSAVAKSYVDKWINGGRGNPTEVFSKLSQIQEVDKKVMGSMWGKDNSQINELIFIEGQPAMEESFKVLQDIFYNPKNYNSSKMAMNGDVDEYMKMATQFEVQPRVNYTTVLKGIKDNMDVLYGEGNAAIDYNTNKVKVTSSIDKEKAFEVLNKDINFQKYVFQQAQLAQVPKEKMAEFTKEQAGKFIDVIDVDKSTYLSRTTEKVDKIPGTKDPRVGEDGFVYRWDEGVGEYVKTNLKAPPKTGGTGGIGGSKELPSAEKTQIEYEGNLYTSHKIPATTIKMGDGTYSTGEVFYKDGQPMIRLINNDKNAKKSEQTKIVPFNEVQGALRKTDLETANRRLEQLAGEEVFTLTEEADLEIDKIPTLYGWRSNEEDVKQVADYFFKGTDVKLEHIGGGSAKDTRVIIPGQKSYELDLDKKDDRDTFRKIVLMHGSPKVKKGGGGVSKSTTSKTSDGKVYKGLDDDGNPIFE